MVKQRSKQLGEGAPVCQGRSRKRHDTVFDVLVVGALAACLAFTLPANALASADGAGASTLDPADRLDLRERGVVTPVKLQDPWGDCWSFAIIAACETSLLSDMGCTYEETGLDLSELQLVASVFRVGGVPASVDAAQAGEGYHNSSANPNAGINRGGYPSYGSTMFASGIGPVLEEDAPYRNKGLVGSDDDIPIVSCKVVYNETDPATGANKEGFLDLSETQVARAEQQIADGDDSCAFKSVTRLNYSGNYLDAQGEMAYTDWTVSDELYTSSLYNLKDGNILPDTRVLDAAGTCTGTDLAAVRAIQGELQKGRGVSVACCSDQSVADPESGQAAYINEKTWAHYTYETKGSNHTVCIVGYDNGYAKDNFGGGDASKQPPADGAWLVKNSWGAETEQFPNEDPQSAIVEGANGWGIVENGKHTGYFWLSYYDKSLDCFESYDFDIDVDEDEEQYYIDQYDYLPESEAVSLSSEGRISSANVFTASADISVTTLSCATCVPNTKVKYELYLLDDEAASPTDPKHSTLAATLEDAYEFAGYHRSKFADEADWVAMKSGQRYSVVVTQQCLDNGLYYQGVAVGDGVKPTPAEVAAYEEEKKVAAEGEYYDLLYSSALARFSKESDPETGQVYTKEKAEKLAKEKARRELASDKVVKAVQKTVDEAVDIYENAYSVAVVNAGESWSGELADGADASQPSSQSTEWTDWTTAVKEPVEEGRDGKVVADNAPIKVFAKLGIRADAGDSGSPDPQAPAGEGPAGEQPEQGQPAETAEQEPSTLADAGIVQQAIANSAAAAADSAKSVDTGDDSARMLAVLVALILIAFAGAAVSCVVYRRARFGGQGPTRAARRCGPPGFSR